MSLQKFTFVLTTLLAVAACGGSGGGSSIDPNDPDAVMKAMAIKVGGNVGVLREGLRPQQDPATAATAPKVEGIVAEIAGGDGDEITAPIEFDSNSPLALLYAKLTGSTTFIEVNLGGTGKAQSLAKLIDTVPVSLLLPSSIRDGAFTLEISVEDSSGLVSNVVRYTVRVGPPTPVASTQNALQGIWRTNCINDFEGESFETFIEFSGSNFAITFFGYLDSTSCTGSQALTEEFDGTFTIGNRIFDADGLRVDEIDFVADEFTNLDIIRVEGNRFYLGDDDTRPDGSDAGRPTRIDFSRFFSRTDSVPSTGNNLPPSVEAGSNVSVEEGAIAILSGSASDADGQIVQTVWQQLSGPTVSLADPNSASTSFSAPAVDGSTTLVFELTATDDRGATASDTVTITVTDSISSSNQPPIVDAGPDASATENGTVSLNGSALDDDGQVVSVQWSQIAGPTVNLLNSNTLNASFTAPEVSAPTSLRFELLAMDDQGATTSDTVTVTINDANLGSGELQVTLTWDNGTDMDLHVIEPSGEEIDFTNRTSATGGMLDVDDTSGFGPENIFWQSAPDGAYQVFVVHFCCESEGSTGTTVTISHNGRIIASRTQTQQPGSSVDYFTLNKSGSQISVTQSAKRGSRVSKFLGHSAKSR